MGIEQYFDNVQEYIKSEIGKDDVEAIILKLKDNNIQSTINQNFYKGVSVEETGDNIIDMIGRKLIPAKFSNEMSGDRTMNKMESIITSFDKFTKGRDGSSKK